MDKQTLKAHEELLDGLGAKADELERRLNALLDLLRQQRVQEALGLKDFDYVRTEPTKMPLEVRTLKHFNARHRAVEKLRQDEVMARLASLSPARLEQLLRER